jgi:type III pantothenate kinase
MLLAIDIGNTNTVVGVFEGPHLKGSFRAASSRETTPDEVGFFITGLLERMSVDTGDVDKVILSSVVPPLTRIFVRTAQTFFHCEALVVSARLKLPIEIRYDQPDQVGADRIANSVAAHAKYGSPVIVIDFGTAINFDIVNQEGAYVGGVLCPGPESSMSELVRKAARLFEVSIEPPDNVVGRSTAEALKSGFYYGTIGQIDFILDKIIEEQKFDNPTVISTGGLANGIEKHSRYIKLIEPNLTLEGLRLIAKLNF